MKKLVCLLLFCLLTVWLQGDLVQAAVKCPCLPKKPAAKKAVISTAKKKATTKTAKRAAAFQPGVYKLYGSNVMVFEPNHTGTDIVDAAGGSGGYSLDFTWRQRGSNVIITYGNYYNNPSRYTTAVYGIRGNSIQGPNGAIYTLEQRFVPAPSEVIVYRPAPPEVVVYQPAPPEAIVYRPASQEVIVYQPASPQQGIVYHPASYSQ